MASKQRVYLFINWRTNYLRGPKRKILINIIIRVGQIDQWDSVVKNENEAGVVLL